MRKISTARLSRGQPTHLRNGKLNSNHALMEPSVQVRELKRDRVNFVLENVDLSYASISKTHDHHPDFPSRFANSLRRVMMAEIPTVGQSDDRCAMLAKSDAERV